MNYYYCPQIDRYLCFNRDNIYGCTVGNNTKGQSLLMIKEGYDGELFDCEAFFDEREKIKEDFKNGKPLETCKGCQQLSLDDWDGINTERCFKYIQLSHWLMCDSNCIYCGNHTEFVKNKVDTYNSVPVMKDMLDKGYIVPDTKIDFAGGEPTLYYKFEELLSLFVEARIKNILIHSNLIRYSKAIEKGIKNGNVSLCVSVDAGSKRIHERVKRVKSYDKVWKHIKKYAKVNNPLYKNQISLKYIIIPGVNDIEYEISIWIDKALEANVDELVLNADNNIFINKTDEAEFQQKLKRVIEITNYFVVEAKRRNVKFRLEYNVCSAFIMQNLCIPN